MLCPSLIQHTHLTTLDLVMCHRASYTTVKHYRAVHLMASLIGRIINYKPRSATHSAGEVNPRAGGQSTALATMLSARLTAACLCLIIFAAAKENLAWTSRSLITETGPNANQNVYVPCNVSAIGSTAGCFDRHIRAVGNHDYPFGSPEVSYPTDGSAWGVHLVGPGSDGTYIVSWQSGAPQVGANVSQPDTSSMVATVRASSAGEAGPWTEYTGAVIRYVRLYNPPKAGGPDRTPYNYLSPDISHVVLANLEPLTTYYYQVTTDNASYSQTYSFKTLANKATYPLKIGLMADIGQSVNASATRDHIVANNPDVVILVGDFTYSDQYGANDTDLLDGIGGTNQNRWDTHSVLWERLFSTTPVVHVAGNHEIEGDGINGTITPNTTSFSFPENYPFQSYSARWPVAGVTGNWGNIDQNLYSKTELGGVATVISLNNYIPFHEGTPQYQWAVDAFKSVDRTKTPWLIVQFHAPPYHTYQTHYKEQECFMSIYEDIFYQYNVDVVLNGHVHAYERTHGVYKYKVDACGPMYITIGDGGNIEGPYRNFVDEFNPNKNMTYCEALAVYHKYKASTPWGPRYQLAPQPSSCTTYSWQRNNNVKNSGILELKPDNPNLGFCQSAQPTWSAYRDPSFGHAILTITSDTEADFAWYRNNDGQSHPADTTTLKRETACQQRSSPLQLPSKAVFSSHHSEGNEVLEAW